MNSILTTQHKDLPISSFISGDGIFRIKNNEFKFFIYNGILYKYHEKFNRWVMTCSFSTSRCYNYCSKNSIYCKIHQNNILNENINKIKTFNGDKLEIFISNILKSSNELKNVTVIGHENSKLDIIFQVEDEIKTGLEIYRGVQIRTLIKNEFNYTAMGLNKYYDDTLLIFINNDMNVFCLFFKNFSEGKDSISFPIRNIYDVDHRLIPYIFNSITENFISKLIQFSKISTIYNPEIQTSERCLKEKKMLLRLKEKCNLYNLVFQNNTTHMSSIDCYINNQSIFKYYRL